MAKIATCTVTLPPAAAQLGPHAKRVVTISGSYNQDGSQDVTVDFVGPLTIKVALDAQVTVSVSEVLGNGSISPPVSNSFTPERILRPAIPPDPEKFAVAVNSVEEA
ncbi:MAG: hypothetical protein ABSG68_08710 [Thermoguttaceae bacterium]|jgi:hypothetical protein